MAQTPEIDGHVVKIIHDSGKRVYVTANELLADFIQKLDIFKNHQITLLSIGVLGWNFEARSQVDALLLEQRLQLKEARLTTSDMRSKRQ
jgi:hypothetical protein